MAMQAHQLYHMAMKLKGTSATTRFVLIRRGVVCINQEGSGLY